MDNTMRKLVIARGLLCCLFLGLIIFNQFVFIHDIFDVIVLISFFCILVLSYIINRKTKKQLQAELKNTVVNHSTYVSSPSYTPKEYKKKSWDCYHEKYECWSRGTCSSCGGTKLTKHCELCGHIWDTHMCN
jgi:hypothetical protein